MTSKEASLLETFAKFRDPSDDTSEASILKVLPLLPTDCELAAFKDDEHGYMFLHYACKNGWYEVTKVLIEEYKCNPKCRNKYGSTPLLLAYRSGNKELINYLIVDIHCDPLHINNYGMNRLHFAILDGRLGMVKHLIEEKRCDSGCRTNDGRAPLHLACRYGWLDVAKYLIKKQHCNPNCTDSDGRTPLHFASEKGHLDVAKYLIEEQQCDHNCKQNEGMTPLHIACQYGQVDVAKYLIEKRHCDPNCTDNKGWTPTYFHSANKQLDSIVKYLMIIAEPYCDHHCIQKKDMTPLHVACLYGQLHVAKYLIEEQHCDPNHTTNNGWTPMHLASRGGKIDIIKYLTKELNSDSNCKTGTPGWTPLHLACYNGHMDIIKHLVEEQHCDLDCRTADGTASLHLASEGGHLDVVKYLIEEQHCDQNCKQNTGMTPLHKACQYGQLCVAKYLIEEQDCDPCCITGTVSSWIPTHFVIQHGYLNLITYCSPDCKDSKGWTPLHLACYGGKLDIVKFLIEELYFYDLDCRTSDGRTPLHLASQMGHLNIVEYLIEEHQSDPNCRTEDGATSMHLACLGGNLKIVEYFLERQCCDLHCTNKFGWTALHFTCMCHLEALDLFFFLAAKSKGYDLTSKDNFRQTLLHCASFNGSFNICKFLVEEHNFSPLDSSVHFTSPLAISLIQNHMDVFLLLLKNTHSLSGFKFGNLLGILLQGMITKLDNHQREIASLLVTVNGIIDFNPSISRQLIQPAIKVFVMGNSLSGKSTLIEALKSGNKQTWSDLFSFRRKVSQVPPHTAGIIPVHIQIDEIGHIIMYDFAGHHEYYSSHAALLETFALSKGTMIIILLNLTESISKLVKTLEYWQSFIRNSCYVKGKGPPVLVMGSHSDIVISEEENPFDKLSLVLKQLKNPLCNRGVHLNCTLVSSEGLNQLKNVLRKIYTYSFKNYIIDLKVQFFKFFVIKKHFFRCTACSVSSLMGKVEKEEFALLRKIELLPLTLKELLNTLTTLSECGELLYLKNSEDVKKGWVILKPLFLLSQVNRLLFSPSNRCTISSETGIVSISRIKELFQYRHRIILNLMTHLEICHRINDSEVLLINKYLFSSVDSDSMEEYYFFPALIKQERPNLIWNSMMSTCYRCGWCLQRREGAEDQFLPPRFIHVLLLRLAILFGQKPDEGYKSQSISIHRECNIWRNGIHFNKDGVATIVEVVEQSTAVVMVMECLEGCEMNCVRYRSELIKVILQTKEQFSGTVEMNELLIHPKEISAYPLKDLDCLLTFNINRLAKAIIEQKKYITQLQGMEKIDSILHFESFSDLTPELISELVDEANTNSEILDRFLHKCARVMSQSVSFKEIILFSTPARKHEFIRTTEQYYHDKYDKDPVYGYISVLKTWKKFTKNPTYKRLREALDMYSVFRGRNPLAIVPQATDKGSSYLDNQDIKEEEKHILEAMEKQGELHHSTVHGVVIGSACSGKNSLMERLLGRMKNPSTGVTKRVVHVQVQKSSSMAAKVEGSIWSRIDYDDEAIFPSLDILKAAINTKSKSFQALQQHFEKTWSLHLSNTGGQIEFQEVFPLLVSGPCIFLYTFRLDRDLNECYEIHHELPDGATSHSYKSSITTVEGIVQSLASIAAMGIFVYRGSQKYKVHLRPKVLFIGTHRDRLNNDLATDIIASIDQNLQKVTRQFSNIITFASEGQMMFAVNNFSQNESIFQEIRSAVERIVERREFEMVSPSHWLIYSLALRRLKAEIVNYEECFEMAKQYGISDREELNEALHFIHTKMGLIRYFPVEHIKDLVIIQPQFLFDTIGFMKTFTSEKRDEKQKGILSLSDFERIHHKSDCTDTMESSQFAELLKVSHIAAPFEEGSDRGNTFFFPCFTGEAQKQTEISDLGVPPLIITFKYGYCPKGLSRALINYLMINEVNSKIQWKLLPDQIYGDQVSFEVGPLDIVTLRTLSTHLMLIYIPKPEFPDRPAHSIGNICFEVQKAIDTRIRNVIQSLNFTASEVEPSFTFLCPCVKCENKHPAETKFHDGRPLILCCMKTRKEHKLPQGYDKWFKLSELHHPALLKQLTEYASCWRAIGVGLSFTPYELDNIEAKPLLLQSAPVSWLSAMLAEWLQWAPGDSRESRDFATLETLKFALLEAGLKVAANDLQL